jgi:quinol monooxygenase YgiN
MVIEYIRYVIPAERRGAFEGSYGEAVRALDASPHCLAYDLARCADDHTQYVLRIEWDSAEGHMAGFRRSAEFQTFLSGVRPFVGDIVEMRHYEPTPLHARKDAGASPPAPAPSF